MKRLHRILAVLLAGAALALTARAADVPRYQEIAIRKMMRLSGMVKMIDQLTEQMAAGIRSNAPAGIPESFWTRVKEKRMNSEELISRLVPVYAKYFTSDDLKVINAFYESPTGQRYNTNLAPVMQECMKVGQAWSQEVAQHVIDDAKAQMDAPATPSAPGGITVPGLKK
jgi:uncharacterized protein